MKSDLWMKGFAERAGTSFRNESTGRTEARWYPREFGD
jgi:hypothetical protein